jgi:hypothetical protein
MDGKVEKVASFELKLLHYYRTSILYTEHCTLPGKMNDKMEKTTRPSQKIIYREVLA